MCIIADRGAFRQHMQRHIGDKRHVCEHCAKSFVTTSDLKKHIRTHTGAKPYACNVCGKAFADGSCMLRHQDMHTPKFKFECGACEKLFSRRDLCVYHIKKKHADLKQEDVGKVSINKISINDDKCAATNIAKITKGRKQVTDKISQTKITTKTSQPPKKAWQNFERLTEVACRRHDEQTSLIGGNHSYHSSLTFGEYHQQSSSHMVPFHPMAADPSHNLYGNQSQQYFQDGRQEQTTVYHHSNTQNEAHI